MRQVSEQLASRGHEVTVATTRLPDRVDRVLNGVQVEAFDISGNGVSGYRGQTSLYQEFLLDSAFDVMMNYAAQQWATDLVFPILDQIKYRKILAPCGFSGLYYPVYADYYAALPRFLRGYDHLVFHASSYRDIEFARQHDLCKLRVIPNGASETEFSHLSVSFRQDFNIPEHAILLLTVGSHTGQKGHRASIQAFRSARIDQAVLVIIGNRLSQHGCARECDWRSTWLNLMARGEKRVLVLDLPRPQVVAAYQAADLFIFPSNIEYSPIVLFEAMASRTPFLSSDCGNAAEIATWGGGGMIVPSVQKPYGRVEVDPSILARAMEDLMADPTRRDQLAQAGYHAWQERFTWEKIALEYESLYAEALEGH